MFVLCFSEGQIQRALPELTINLGFIGLGKNNISNVSLFGIDLLHDSILSPILMFQGVNIFCFAKQVAVWNLQMRRIQMDVLKVVNILGIMSLQCG